MTSTPKRRWFRFSLRAKFAAAIVALYAVPVGVEKEAAGEDASVAPQFTLRGHNDWVSCVAFSPDGETLASAGPHVKLWNPRTGELLSTLETENTSQNFIRYSSDGKILFSARGDGEVVWHLGGDKRLTWLKNPTGATNIAVCPQGRALAVIMNSKDIDIWTFGEKDQPTLIEGGATEATALVFPRSLEFSPNGKLLATGHAKGRIRIWDVASARLSTTIDAYEPNCDVTCVAFTPDGRNLAAGAVCSERPQAVDVTLWNVESGKLASKFTGNKDGVSDLAFSQDGRTIVSGGRDATVRVWDVESRTPIATLRGHGDAVTAIAISRGGLIASGSGDRTVRVWKLPALRKGG